MYTTDLEGRINNYPVEPKIYHADYPDAVQQGRYALQGALATLFITFLLLTAFTVS